MDLRHTFRKDRNLTRWLFVLPAMLVVISLLIYPVFSTLLNSFTNRTLIRPAYKFIGFNNYTNILKDTEFHNAFFNTLTWTFFSLLGQVVIGFIGALCLNRVQGKIPRAIYRICMIIPWAFPSIAIALVWKWLLNGIYGFIPSMLSQLNLSEGMIQFLSTSELVMPTLIFVNIWFGSPLIMVNTYAALQTIPQDQYEAAQIDGANAWQSFRAITVPHIKVVIGLLVVLRTIWVFNSFDIIYMMTAGGPASVSTTMSIYIYKLAWTSRMTGRASAAAVILLIFLLAISAVYFTLLRKWEREDL